MAESKKTTKKKVTKSVKNVEKAPVSEEQTAPDVVKAEPVKEAEPAPKAEEAAPVTEAKPEVEAAPAEAEKAAAPKEDESDFADEAKPIPAPAPVVEAKPEEKPEEAKPEVELHVADAPVYEAPKTAPEATYDDETLKGVETARQLFYKTYKSSNVTKWIVTGVCLVLILAGWLIPNYVEGVKGTAAATYITIGVLVFACIILGVYSFMFKKKLDTAMKAYFLKYYELTNAYVFGNQVENLRGTVDDKLDPAIFNAAGLYKNVAKVGSRDTLHFSYKGQEMLLADCAGQVNGGKALQTVFVGKLATVPNAWNGPDTIIYLKGNKRALPPTSLSDYSLIEDTKSMVVYGSDGSKKALSQPVRKALAAINTNETLVDVAISLKAGTTYIALGYEDNLMVLPLEKPFNPAPIQEFKANFALILSLVDAFGEHQHD